MAWTVKPSATLTIERREQPYLTPKMRTHHEENTLPRYETKQGSLISILHEIQETYGHVPHQAMEEIAEFLEIHPSEVLDCVSFYEEFHHHKVGKYIIAVCQSIACEVCGHEAILDHLREKLGIEPHDTTDDGKFTLLALECLGACEGAPCALVNDDRHDNLTIERMDKILEGCK